MNLLYSHRSVYIINYTKYRLILIYNEDEMGTFWYKIYLFY